MPSFRPRKNARPWKPSTAGAIARNEALRASKYLGRGIWRKWSGYHRRSRAETKPLGIMPHRYPSGEATSLVLCFSNTSGNAAVATCVPIRSCATFQTCSEIPTIGLSGSATRCRSPQSLKNSPVLRAQDANSGHACMLVGRSSTVLFSRKARQEQRKKRDDCTGHAIGFRLQHRTEISD